MIILSLFVILVVIVGILLYFDLNQKIQDLREQHARLEHRVTRLSSGALSGSVPPEVTKVSAFMGKVAEHAKPNDAPLQPLATAPVSSVSQAEKPPVSAASPAPYELAPQAESKMAEVLRPKTVIAGANASERQGNTPINAPATYRKSFSIEQLLSMKVLVWLATISVAIAGLLFVKYAAEHSLISPPIRMMMAGGFGIALIAVAQWRVKKNNYIAQGLSAAGVATLFGTVYAATEVFHMVAPTAGFGLMVAVTAIGLILSLKHGQLVAAIGLLGGFLTPAIIKTGSANPAPLFGYLILLHVAVVAVSRMRGWSVLNLVSSIISLLWVAAWVAFYPVAEHATMLSGFVLASVATTMIFMLRQRDERTWFGGRVLTTCIGFATLVPSFILLMVILASTDFSAMQWGFLGVMSVAALLLARFKTQYSAFSYVAAFLMLAMLNGYALAQPRAAQQPVAILPLSNISVLYMIFGGLFTVGGFACMWRSARPMVWGILTSLCALSFTFTIWLSGNHDPLEAAYWSWAGVAAGGVLLAMTIPLFLNRGKNQQADMIISWFIASASLLLWIPCITLPLGAARPACYAVIGLIMAIVCRYARLKQLRAMPFVHGMAMLILLIPLYQYYMNDITILLCAYVPAIAVSIITIVLMNRDYRNMSHMIEVQAILGVMTLCALLVNFSFNKYDGRVFSVCAEWATHVMAQLLVGYGLMMIGARLNRGVSSWFSQIMVPLGMIMAVMVPAVLKNPVITGEEMGHMVMMNQILFVLGAPMAIILIILLCHRRMIPQLAGIVGHISVLILAFLLITGEIRHAYHLPVLTSAGTMMSSELYTYSAAWLIFGGVLLALAVMTRSMTLRWASLAMILLTVGKVFMIDAANLKDLWRVLSFLGLGLTLFVVAYVYQRFVFKPIREKSALLKR